MAEPAGAAPRSTSHAREWLLAGLVTVAILAIARLGAPPAGSSRAPPDLSTLRSSGGGARALDLTLNALGIPTARRLTPLADADPIVGPLALLAPTQPLSPREVEALGGWIEGGGTLLYVARPGDPVATMLRLHLIPLPPDSTESLDSVALRPWPAWLARRTATPTDHPWTAGLGPVHGFHWAIVPAQGTNATPLLQVPARPAGGAAAPPASAARSRRQRPAARRWLSVALEIRRGRGRVLAISDPGPLANREILSDGLAPLFVRAAADFLAAAGADTLRFDEYHHGARGASVPSAVAAFLGRTRPGHVLVQLSAVALLALLAAAIRFGAPVALPAARRSALEHVDALARAYAGADVRRRGRLLLMAGLARRLGRVAPADDEEAVALVSRLSASRLEASATARALSDAIRDDAPPATVAAHVDRLMTELRQ